MQKQKIQFISLFIIIGIGIIVAASLIAINNNRAVTDNQTPSTQYHIEAVQASPTVLIYGNPQTVKKGASSVDIMIDAKENLVSAVQLEIQYDRGILSNVKLTPASGNGTFFGGAGEHFILFNDAFPSDGRLSYGVGISPTSLSRAGTGKIATLSFTKQPDTTQTTITFLKGTTATQVNVNKTVLKNAQSITIQ